jgi:alpha-ribazole phosphatase
MKLVLVRHAQTTAAEGQCYGRTDVSVLPGVNSAVAERVAPLLPADIEMSCSPLMRCADLAQALQLLRPDLGIRTDRRIAEMDMGSWEGGPWAAIDRTEFENWTLNFADTRAGGSGESTRQFMQRVGEAFDDWRERGQDAIWITHAGVIRAVSLLNAGMRCADHTHQWPARPIAYGECVTIEG